MQEDRCFREKKGECLFVSLSEGMGGERENHRPLDMPAGIASMIEEPSANAVFG